MHDDTYLETVIAKKSFAERWKTYLVQKIELMLSNRVITVSEGARERIASRYGQKSKISVIENGVNIEEFRPLRLEISKLILFVGNMKNHFERKGISTLLEAISILVHDFPSVILTTIGTLDDKFEPEVDRLAPGGMLLVWVFSQGMN